VKCMICNIPGRICYGSENFFQRNVVTFDDLNAENKEVTLTTREWQIASCLRTSSGKTNSAPCNKTSLRALHKKVAA
jgi:sulfur relay (sulfurtransferase) DsrC/TusE family protein